MEIVRWMPYPNHHQKALWDSVEESLDDRILFVFSIPLIEVRKNLGWKPLDYSDHPHIYIKSLLHGKSIIDQNIDAIHLFQNFMGPRYMYLILIFYALCKKVRLAVTPEAYAIDAVSYFENEIAFLKSIKQKGRKYVYRSIIKIIRCFFPNNVPMILAISPIAERQFIDLGYPPNSIYSFGYFIPKIERFELPSRFHKDGILHIVFLGSLTETKGLPNLLSAMKKLGECDTKIELSIFGSLQGGEYYEELDLQNVTYHGKVAPDVTQSIISGYDFLILPSIHDGWGVVVNEALLNGVPVIVSDRVGAACLLKGNNAGLVFNYERDDLFNLLNSLAKDKDLQIRLKQNALNFPLGNITPLAGANQVINSLFHYYFKLGNKPFLYWGEN